MTIRTIEAIEMQIEISYTDIVVKKLQSSMN